MTSSSSQTDEPVVTAGRPSIVTWIVGARTGWRRRSGQPVVLLGPIVGFLFLFFLAPLGFLLVVSFLGVDRYANIVPAFTFEEYRQALTNSYLSSTLWQTTLMSLEVTVLCLVLAYPAAHALVTARSQTLRIVLYATVVSPLLTSVIVRTYGWIVLLAANGVVNQALVAAHITAKPLGLLFNYGAVVVSVTHVLLPFAVLPLATAIGGVDPNLAKASAIMGANRLVTFWRVMLPLTFPGIVSSAILVFVLAMGIYITPLLVGGSTQPLTPVRVYVEVTQLFNIPVAAALSFMLLAITLVISVVLNQAMVSWEKRNIG